jgi:hypothetical protein
MKSIVNKKGSLSIILRTHDFEKISHSASIVAASNIFDQSEEHGVENATRIVSFSMVV